MKSDSLQVGNFTFKWGSKTYVMGILNITPDSFSGDGLIPPLPSGEGRGEGKSPALEQAKQFLKNGAEILDIGGESTRPGSQPVTAEEELARVIPVIQDIRKNFPDALISIDTSKADVAEAGFKAGANILNDVWALRADPRLASVAAAFRVPVILMHNRSNPASVEVRERLGNTYIGSEYEDLIEDVKRELPPEQIVRNMRSIGMNLQKPIDDGLLKFHSSRPTVHGLEMHLVEIHQHITKFKPRVIVLDPITNLVTIGSVSEVKSMLIRLIDFLQANQITVLFTALNYNNVITEQTDEGVSSLVDTWITVRDLESR